MVVQWRYISEINNVNIDQVIYNVHTTWFHVLILLSDLYNYAVQLWGVINVHTHAVTLISASGDPFAEPFAQLGGSDLIFKNVEK